MGHMWEVTNIQLLLEELMILWFEDQEDIIQSVTVKTEEELETQIFLEINRIRG